MNVHCDTETKHENATGSIPSRQYDTFSLFFSTIYSSATIHVRTCREASDLATVIFSTKVMQETKRRY